MNIETAEDFIFSRITEKRWVTWYPLNSLNIYSHQFLRVGSMAGTRGRCHPKYLQGTQSPNPKGRSASVLEWKLIWKLYLNWRWRLIVVKKEGKATVTFSEAPSLFLPILSQDALMTHLCFLLSRSESWIQEEFFWCSSGWQHLHVSSGEHQEWQTGKEKNQYWMWLKKRFTREKILLHQLYKTETVKKFPYFFLQAATPSCCFLSGTTPEDWWKSKW